MNFYPVITEDGTISLYNKEVGDIYHSKIGAYKEALTKFINPSGLLELVREKEEVRILDICYGLGYNTKAAVSEVWKINPDCKIHITALENDPYVLAYSTLVQSEFFNSKANQIIFASISEVINVDYFKLLISDDVNFTQPLNANSDFNGYKLSPTDKIEASLHNIYYRSVSNRDKNIVKCSNNADNLEYVLYIGDARDSVKLLETSYDIIFHDAFTPSKLPTLWSVDFFRYLHKLLNKNGNLTTYSKAAPARSGLLEAGFFIGSGSYDNNKWFGTFACKKIDYILNELSEMERGVLNTNAGIPYYDPDLNFTSEEIHSYRKSMLLKSDRISSSKFYNNFKKS